AFLQLRDGGFLEACRYCRDRGGGRCQQQRKDGGTEHAEPPDMVTRVQHRQKRGRRGLSAFALNPLRPLFCQAAREARLRSVSVRNFLRRRISVGVTSTSSSSSMKSSACSGVDLMAGLSWIASSLPEARMLVSGLGLITLTVRSLSFEWMP